MGTCLPSEQVSRIDDPTDDAPTMPSMIDPPEYVAERDYCDPQCHQLYCGEAGPMELARALAYEKWAEGQGGADEHGAVLDLDPMGYDVANWWTVRSRGR